MVKSWEFHSSRAYSIEPFFGRFAIGEGSFARDQGSLSAGSSRLAVNGKRDMASSQPVKQTSDPWASRIETCLPAILSVKVSKLCDIDGSTRPSSSQGTGFVVDAAKGLVLTNRHVAGVGPGTHRIETSKGDSAEATPVYLDPIHDFAILAVR